MKEYKEEYKLLYKERLELAQTPVEDKDSQKKLEEQKEFQKKLEEKAKVPSTEAEEGMPYLAKRCGCEGGQRRATLLACVPLTLTLIVIAGRLPLLWPRSMRRSWTGRRRRRIRGRPSRIC
jgi:hypothetical protein